MPETAEATMPMDMLKVTPPSGTRMHRLGVDREEGKDINQFGVVSMAHGRIRTFNEKPGETPEYVDGTHLYLSPGPVQIEVARRGLSGEEINRIGVLSVDIDNTYRMQTLLSEISTSTTKAVDGLRMFASASAESGVQVPAEEVDTKAEQEIERVTGVVPSVLRTRKDELDKKLDSLYLEADNLGVAHIRALTGATRDGSVSIKLAADQVRAKQNTTPSKS